MSTKKMASAHVFPALGPAKTDPYKNRRSLEFSFRAKRFADVRRLIEKVFEEKGHAEVIDLGGTETYWLIGEDFIRANRHRLHFTVVNTEPQVVEDEALFSFLQASATDPDLFSGRSFDLVHSNSVIEHVGIWPDMQRFAANTRRLAPRYYVQTPNYWFAYEPHFRFPGFQYLPERVRVALIQNFALGFFQKVHDRAEAEDIIYHHRLISTRQMRALFPDAKVSHEKVARLNKSILAIREAPVR